MTSTRTSLSTPCPAPSGLNPSHRRISSFELFADDTTSNIDYTRAVEQPLTTYKPRRRSMMGGSKAKRAPPVTVFEDLKEDQELELDDKNQKSVQGKTLLSKPAQKLAMVGGGGKAIGEQLQQQGGGQGEQGVNRRIKSQGVGFNTNRKHLVPRTIPPSEYRYPSQTGMRMERSIRFAEAKNNAPSGDEAFGITKKARRATLFVQDDTTQLTIHPGANNTSRLDDSFYALAVQPPSVPTQHDENVTDPKQPSARRHRMSLAAAPKRLPLGELRANNNLVGWDVAGCNTGKENLSPRGDEQLKKRMKGLTLVEDVAASRYNAALKAPAPSAGSQAPTLKTTVSFNFRRDRPAGVPFRKVSTELIYETVEPRPTTIPQKANVRTSAHFGKTSKQPTPPKPKVVKVAEEKERVRSFIASKRNEQQAAKVKEYPILSGDLSQPELYEDDWLFHQEIALTEIANDIFAKATPKVNSFQGEALRQKLIEIYNQHDVALLHRRIQASLEYGALSPPTSSFPLRCPSLDIGLHKRLINLWLDTYDETVLRIAAEVIAGRQIPRMADCSSCSYGIEPCTVDPHAERRALSAFIELFFVSVADVTGGSEIVPWRKIMSRGIMLVLLLDKAKSSGFMEGCLFKSTSTKKSSAAVLNAFASLLLPSVGDINRSLKHMGYEITQIQKPIDEVVNRIDNLATDLRNGVLLTRLVDILLCSRESRDHGSMGIDGTLTVALPDDTVLFSSLLDEGPSLAYHLKMPCLGAAEQKYNIQLALSALESHSIDGQNVVGDITAKDIFDGHREKTLSLLWHLVSIFGLEHLINWRELSEDIASRKGKAGIIVLYNEAVQTAEGHNLLQAWASAHAVEAGLPAISNMTTAFADGRVYSTILGHFSSVSSTSTTTEGQIRDYLTALGCSKAFINQLASSVGTFPSRETTVSNLAFLASRLLPLGRRYRAAVKIQEAFRAYLGRK